MILLKLAWKSLKNRRAASALTVCAIALSVYLLLAVEMVRRTAEDSFTQSVSQVDLIVGARTGPMELILFTVFNIGNATNGVSYKTYEKWKNHPSVEWTIPYSLGDGHRGFRVVGTNLDFFKYYRYRGDGQVEFQQGEAFSDIQTAVVGAEVARILNYQLGQSIVVAHGVTRTEGVIHHDKDAFKISGILKATGTPLDRAVYVSLEAIEHLHEEGDHHDGDHGHHHEHSIDQITSFFLRTKSRIETLQLQRDINTNTSEPLVAVIPGVALAELWNSLSYAEAVLKVISFLVVAVGFVAMLIALMTSLNERRREMAILRSLGARPNHIFILLVLESGLLTLLGMGLGLMALLLTQSLLGNWISNKVGLYIAGGLLKGEWLYLLFILIWGLFLGCLPAIQALKRSLKDGLSVRL